MKKSLLAVAAVITILTSGSVSAQTMLNGPYYATPSWDQQELAAQRFIVLQNWNNLAVLDRETGLVWERTPSTTPLPAILPPNVVSGNYAAGRCILLTLGGRAGWRVPTIQELESLVDTTQNPMLPFGHPFNGISGPYWTSTQFSGAALSGSIYAVNFDNGLGFGLGFTIAPPNSSDIKVWCVRSGSGQLIQ